MSQDPVIAAIDEVEATAARLHQAIDAVTGELTHARALRRGGEPVSLIVRRLLEAGGRELRLLPSEAAADYERAVSSYRAAAIRELVDAEAMTFTEVAALTGVSRQMVARLYRAGTTNGGGP